MLSNWYIRQKGFTLLELLVAITIFATMTIMAYGGLSNVITNSESSGKALARLQEVQQTMLNLERDFSQIVERKIRDEFGEVKNYIVIDSNTGTLIEFTRSGRRNPARLLRSNLIRVAYKLDEGKLIRMYWPHLDRVQGMVPYETSLLTGVTNVEIRFLDNNAEWHSTWPPLNASSSAVGTTIFLSAIDYRITLDDWGEISRLFRVKS